jgi:hypothetical protein
MYAMISPLIIRLIVGHWRWRSYVQIQEQPMSIAIDVVMKRGVDEDLS